MEMFNLNPCIYIKYLTLNDYGLNKQKTINIIRAKDLILIS
jgi:hypothetical protein